ncbi:MAG: ankyrin repeat domain-containing protein [Pseudomonadota bacterium]
MPLRPRSFRWPALLLTGLALHAVAQAADPVRRGSSYFSTQPADGRQDLQHGWPPLGAEYTPPQQSDATAPPTPTDRAPLAAAIAGVNADLALAILRNDIPGTQALLLAGANVNCTDCAGGQHAGQTPLMLAARYGAATSPQNHLLRLLLRHGANPNARTPAGHTALFFAAQAGLRLDTGAIDTVTELLHAAADPAVAAQDGSTAIFWWAAGSIDAREHLYPQSRDTIYRDFLAIAKSFHARGADLSQREARHGMTALHVAAMHCNPHGVLLTQAIGVDAATGDSRLLTPKELVERRIRDEGESRTCHQTLEALDNKALVNHWKRIAFQVAPLIPAGR